MDIRREYLQSSEGRPRIITSELAWLGQKDPCRTQQIEMPKSFTLSHVVHSVLNIEQKKVRVILIILLSDRSRKLFPLPEILIFFLKGRRESRKHSMEQFSLSVDAALAQAQGTGIKKCEWFSRHL